MNTDNVAPVIERVQCVGLTEYMAPATRSRSWPTPQRPLQAGGQIRVTLSNGEELTLTVTSAGSNQLRGDYTVAADDTSDGDLDVASFLLGDGVDADTVPKDLFGNPMTGTVSLPTNMTNDGPVRML